ncbi:MAG: HAMP domain-containing sensor histidine kinase [Candidatus Riflebacteria bacterium]|nr:HAMP domain-containing sensor histidine kinase [Candidatus Riflebacteria bacterium]
MIQAQTFAIIATFALLVVILIISGVARGRRSSHINHEFTKMAVSYFENNDFPSAIVNRQLEICFKSRSFNNTYLSIPDTKSFADLFSLFPFSDCPELQTFLISYKNEGSLPEKPVFFSLKEQKFVAKQAFSGSYFMVRRIPIDTGNTSGYLCISLIPADYTGMILENLTKQIARNESHLKELEELDRLKSEFLATLSHELKTPLVSIKGYLDLMATQKMGPLTEKQEKALRISLKNTSHLNNMISSILNFARMEAGKLKFDRVNQKISPLINDIIDSLKPMSESQQITISAELDPLLPVVSIDADLIHRVLSNLLENSIKFSSPGSAVIITAKPCEADRIKVEVVDQGCGIPADKLEFIKFPFFQADKSDTRPTGGLGLGLAIAEKILIGHGSTLTIESVEGQGTKCSFLLRTALA